MHGGLGGSWDPAVIEATAQFDQGDLVERPPLFYAADPSHAVLPATAALVDEVSEGEDVVIEIHPDDRPPFGVLTSQSCDIADTSRKPWVQVAPVYEAAAIDGGEQRLSDVGRNAVPHLVLLDPPELDGLWVADLRLEVPVEKSWLAGRTPIPAFADEDDRAVFARRLAGRLERPALPDAVHEAVVRPLRRFLDRAGSQLREALVAARVEFRLALRSHPDGTHECRLLVIGRGDVVPGAVHDALEKWWEKLGASEDPNVTVLGSRYCTSDELSMREYLASVLLDGRFLGEDADVA